MDLFTAVGLDGCHVLHVHDAERDMTGFVLRAEAVDVLFGIVVRHQFAHAEEREDAAFAADVESRGHLREVARRIDVATDDAEDAAVALHEATAVHEGALAEDIEVTGFVHDLRSEVHAGLVEIRRALGNPLAGDIAGDEFDLGDKGRELAFSALDLVRQGLNRLPGNVRGGRPLPCDSLFV